MRDSSTRRLPVSLLPVTASPDSSIYVAGTGSFALEVIEFAAAAGFEVAGLVEPIDSSRIGGSAHGLNVIAPGSPPSPSARFVVGVSANRRSIAAELESAGWSAVTVVHPSAVISSSAEIGKGVVIGPLVVIGAASAIGDHSLIGRGALVGHHTKLGQGTVLYPGANLAGRVTCGEAVMVGMGAAVADGLRIGDRAVIAAGAVVVRDVESGWRVQGVPAKRFVAAAAAVR